MFSHALVKNAKNYDKYFIIKEYNKNTLIFNEGQECNASD